MTFIIFFTFLRIKLTQTQYLTFFEIFLYSLFLNIVWLLESISVSLWGLWGSFFSTYLPSFIVFLGPFFWGLQSVYFRSIKWRGLKSGQAFKIFYWAWCPQSPFLITFDYMDWAIPWFVTHLGCPWGSYILSTISMVPYDSGPLFAIPTLQLIKLIGTAQYWVYFISDS